MGSCTHTKQDEKDVALTRWLGTNAFTLQAVSSLTSVLTVTLVICFSCYHSVPQQCGIDNMNTISYMASFEPMARIFKAGIWAMVALSFFSYCGVFFWYGSGPQKRESSPLGHVCRHLENTFMIAVALLSMLSFFMAGLVEEASNREVHNFFAFSGFGTQIVYFCGTGIMLLKRHGGEWLGCCFVKKIDNPHKRVFPPQHQTSTSRKEKRLSGEEDYDEGEGEGGRDSLVWNERVSRKESATEEMMAIMLEEEEEEFDNVNLSKRRTRRSSSHNYNQKLATLHRWERWHAIFCVLYMIICIFILIFAGLQFYFSHNKEYRNEFWKPSNYALMEIVGVYWLSLYPWFLLPMLWDVKIKFGMKLWPALKVRYWKKHRTCLVQLLFFMILFQCPCDGRGDEEEADGELEELATYTIE
ncbi:hypothetical protein QOT17_014007 [Balamuthia mandrillaris]